MIGWTCKPGLQPTDRRFLEILASTFMVQDHGPGSLIIWKNFLSQTCSMGPYLKCTLLLKHVCYMLLEQYAYQIRYGSWSIFNLEYSSRSLMVQDHMVLDHKSRPKSQIVDSRTTSRITPNSYTKPNIYTKCKCVEFKNKVTRNTPKLCLFRYFSSKLFHF